MKHGWLALLLVSLAATPGWSHFIWIVPERNKLSCAAAQVVFSESLQPDKAKLLQKIAHTQWFVRNTVGTERQIFWTEEKDTRRLLLSGKDETLVGGVCRYGVLQRGNTDPFLLLYYPKALIEPAAGSPHPDIWYQPCQRLTLELMPVREDPNVIEVLWQGKPLVDAEVHVWLPGQESDVEQQTDAKGQLHLRPRQAGLCGIRVLHVEKKEGEHQGKQYRQIRHYATLVTGVNKPASEPPVPAAFPKVKEDPAASQLLTEARSARAQWLSFPGFTADIVVNFDGDIYRGKATVESQGKVHLNLENAEAAAWARRQLSSIASHRLDNSASLQTPCAFLDNNAHHPLGRALRVLNDEFHSSYRVRDRQIIVVHRQMAGSRFAITVLENRLNAEKKYLPISFVVDTWDLKTGDLKNSQAHHQTWLRLGQFDLPKTLTVVTAASGKAKPGDSNDSTLSTRQLTLSDHRLLSSKP